MSEEPKVEIGPKEDMELQIKEIESLLQKIKKAVDQQDPSTYDNDDAWSAVNDAMQKLGHAEMLIVEQE